MILRRSGGIRLQSFPHGDAEQVKGTFTATFFVSLMHLFSTGCMTEDMPFSFLCAPDLKQLFLFAIPSSFFSTAIFPFLFRWMVLLSGGVAPACQPSIAAVSPSLSLSPGCSSISVSPPPPPLLSWQPTGIQFSLLVKIKGAESVPLGAEERVMESRSLSWEYSSENI